MTAVLSTRPPAVCPVHPEYELEGGPIHYRCPLHHSVPAADITREVPLPMDAQRLTAEWLEQTGPQRATVAQAIRDALVTYPGHLDCADEEITSKLTAALAAGDRSWETAVVIVIDAFDRADENYTIDPIEAARIAGTVDEALAPLGLAFTIQTTGDLMSARDAGREVAR
jgi:hypothetical protein